MTPNWVWLTFITIAGACVGSFLNVVVYRLPEGLSLVTPPSRCPKCENRLAFYDNVPVLGWLWLRGKCRKCKAPISVQYPLVELLTAGLFGLSFILFYMLDGWRKPLGLVGFDITQTYPLFLVWMVMLAGLIAATLIDAKHYIIPLGIPWLITLVAFVVLPLGVYFNLPAVETIGTTIGFEPHIPAVTKTGAMVAWGGAAGLILAIVLLRVGVLPDSFEGEDDEALDENGEFPPLKHPRLVALKELMFIALPLLGMLVGHSIASRDLIAQPDGSAWYYVLAGSVLGYLVGGGLIWLIRILGTLGFGKEAMGLGDVHLLGAIGAVLGWHESVFICIFIAPFLGLIITLGMKLLASINNQLDKPIPYGPYLAAAGVILLLFGSARMDVVYMYRNFMSSSDPAYQDQIVVPGREALPLFVP